MCTSTSTTLHFSGLHEEGQKLFSLRSLVVLRVGSPVFLYWDFFSFSLRVLVMWWGGHSFGMALGGFEALELRSRYRGGEVE